MCATDITEMNRGKTELSRVANDLTRLIDTANAPICNARVSSSPRRRRTLRRLADASGGGRGHASAHRHSHRRHAGSPAQAGLPDRVFRTPE